jgi:hypothetical protein
VLAGPVDELPVEKPKLPQTGKSALAGTYLAGIHFDPS